MGLRTGYGARGRAARGRGVTGYGVVARVFHWATVLLVLPTIPIGFVMTQGLPRGLQNLLFATHKAIGVTMLILIALRLAWRIGHGVPAPAPLPRIQRVAAALVHWALYLAIFGMALSGYVRVVSGGFPIEILNALGVPPLLPKNAALASLAKTVHEMIAPVLVLLIAGHVAAACYHALVLKDGVASRMLPPFSA